MTVQVFKSQVTRSLLLAVLLCGLYIYTQLRGANPPLLFIFLLLIVPVIGFFFWRSFSKVIITETGITYERVVLSDMPPRFDVAFNDITNITVIRGVFTGTKKLKVTMKDGSEQIADLKHYPQLQDILHALQTYIAVDMQPVTFSGKVWRDTGQRWRLLYDSAIVVCGLSFMAHSFCQSWHINDLYLFSCLLLLVPLCTALAYAYIRGEQKQLAGWSSLLAGSVLAFSMNMILLNINHLHTEFQGQAQAYQFKLVEQGSFYQRWEAQPGVNSLTKSFTLKSDLVSGFNKALLLSHTYQIRVSRGAFNDIAFAPDAFKNAIDVVQKSMQHNVQEKQK